MKSVIRTAARDDILRQYRYYLIEKDAEAAAGRFTAAVHSAIAQACKHPAIGTPKALNNPEVAGLRSRSVKGFPAMRVYYLVSGDRLQVLRVLHGKRDLTRILEVEFDI